MPRRDPMEAQWPPASARLLCYGCGLKFASETVKNRCRLCFDIFCSQCCAGEAHMPSSYGYSSPQLVCRTCQHLIALFPTFLGPLESGNSASQGHRAALLPPNFCVVVLSSTLSKDTSHDASGGPRSLGAMERFAQWVTKGTRTFKCTDVKPLTLGAFRPINPDSKICVGREIFLSLGQICDITAENGVLTISVHSSTPGAPAESVRLLVGSVPGLASASLIGKDASTEEGDVHDGNSMVFTVDPDCATAVAASLKELRQHLRQHFAFSQSAACISQAMQRNPPQQSSSSSSSSTASPAAKPPTAAAGGADGGVSLPAVAVASSKATKQRS